MGVRIYVDYFEIELGDKPVQIPCTYQLLDVKDINKRKGSTTKTVQVPRTAMNDKIFGFAFDINGRNAFDKYSEHRVLIEEDTLPIFDGLLKLTNVTEKVIEFFCFKDISKIKSLFGDKTLQDLNLSDLDHLYDVTIFDTWNGTYPTGVAADYFYPVIDYVAFREKATPGTAEEPAINVVDLFPMVYNRRLVLQTMLDNGYSLNTTFFDDPNTSKTGVAFTNAEFIHSVIGGIQINGFQGYSNTVNTILDGVTGEETLPMDVQEVDPLSQWDTANDEYIALASQTTTFLGNIGIRITNNTVPISAYIRLQKYDGSWSDLEVIPVESPTFSLGLYPFEFNLVVTLLASEKFRVLIDKVDADADVEAILYTMIADPSAGGKTIEEGEVVQLAPNLPPMKQADYIAALYKIYNWIINVDDIKGEVIIETFDEFYFGGEQIDVSPLLTLQPEPSIQYLPLEYSRKYDFKYKHDDKDLNLLLADGRQGNAGYLFGDGSLYLDERGEATTIGIIPFSPTIVEKSFSDTIDIPTMIVYPYVAGVNTAHTPRMLINAGLQSISTLSEGVETELYIQGVGLLESIPFCYFQKVHYNDASIDTILENLSFSTPLGQGQTLGNLVDKYYRNSIESLSVSPQVIAYFNLNPQFVSEINFSNLWYVDYFKAVFRLNKIVDYLPNGNSPTKVELIKVGVFNPNVPQFEEYT